MNIIILFRSWMSKCCNNNKLTTSVYRKVEFLLISKDLYPQFTNSVYYIVALMLLPLAKNVLKKIFKLNGYSIHFIGRCIKQFLQKLYVTSRKLLKI